MDLKSGDTLKKFNKLVDDYQCFVEDEDYERFKPNRNLLARIAKVENSSLTVYDLNRKQYLLSDWLIRPLHISIRRPTYFQHTQWLMFSYGLVLTD